MAPLGDAFLVNTFTAGEQQTAGNQSVAMDAAGDFVVVWQSQGQDGDGWGIYCQRFDPAGQKLGGEFRVNSTTAGDQTNPVVAMNASGQFMVAWNNGDQATAGTMIQRYDATGHAMGGEFWAFGGSGVPQVGMSDSGRTFVAFDGGPSSAGRLYSETGEVVSAEISAAAGDLRMDGRGLLTQVWYSNPLGGPLSALGVRRWDSNGAAMQTSVAFVRPFIPYAFGLGPSGQAVVALDGSLDVAKLAAADDALGGLVLAVPGVRSIAVDDHGNSFVVRWDNTTQQASLLGYDASGAADPSPSVAATVLGNYAVATSSGQSAVVVWSGPDYSGSGQAVHARVFRRVANAPTVTGVLLSPSSLPLLEGDVADRQPNPLIVEFSSPLSVEGGEAGEHSVTNRANWQLLRDGVDVSSLIVAISFESGSAVQGHEARISLSRLLDAGEYTLRALATIANVEGTPLAGDGTHEGTDFVRSFRVPWRAVAGSGDTPSITATAKGNVLVAWTEVDASGLGSVHARQYDGDSSPIGPVLDIDDVSTGVRSAPTVAADASGRFVVVWAQQDPADMQWRLWMRRFDAQGGVLGSAGLVDDAPSNEPRLTSLSINAAGNGVIVWSDQAGKSVFAQRLSTEAGLMGAKVFVGESEDQHPSVAMSSDGRFVVAWVRQSFLAYSDDATVVVRFFASDGDPTTESIAVNAGFRFGGGIVQSASTGVALDEQSRATVVWDESYSWCDCDAGPDFGSNSSNVWLRQVAPEGPLAAATVVAGDFTSWSEEPYSPARPIDIVDAPQIASLSDGRWRVLWSRKFATDPVTTNTFTAVYDAKLVQHDLTKVHAGESLSEFAPLGGTDAAFVWVDKVANRSSVMLQVLPLPDPAQPGDVDGDGHVGLTDFGLLKASFGLFGDRGKGDLTGDGVVDLDDFAILKANFGRFTTPGGAGTVTASTASADQAVARLFEPVVDTAAFAQALAASGAKMYGAFWCPHCQAQEALFGDAAVELPYEECSNPDHSRNQTAIDNNISSYPTWVFADGSRHVGEMALDELSAASGMPLSMISAQTQFQQALDRLMTQFGQSGSGLTGDLDQDGHVDFDDFGLAKENQPAAAAG